MHIVARKPTKIALLVLLLFFSSWEKYDVKIGGNLKNKSFVLFTFLSSSENFGGVKHSRLSDDPFIGTVEKHMSSHYCVPAGCGKKKN